MADEGTDIAAPQADEVVANVEEGGAAAAAAPATEERKERRERKVFTTKPETVEQPDEAAKNKQVAAHEAKVAQYDKRCNDIRAIIAQQTTDRSSSGDQSKTLRDELKPLKARSTALREQRGAILAEITKQTEARKAAQTKLSEMKKTLRVGSLEEIDARIASIEYEMSTSTLSLKEEKALMNEIKALRASREQVRAVESMSSSVHALAADTTTSSKSLHEQLKDLDQEMSVLRVREKDVITQLDAMRAKFQTSGPSIPELLKEQKALYGKIREEREAIRNLENGFKKQLWLFKNYERDMRDWKWQQDQVKYQERQKQREEWKKEREAEEDESQYKKIPTHPWAEELFIVDDLIKYCKKHVPKTAASAAKASSGSDKKKEFDPATFKAGLIPIGKGVSTDDDIEWAGPMSKKKGGKKGGSAAAAAAANGAPAAAAAAAPAAPAEDKKLSLSMDAYTGFITVGVKPPVFASQCAATLQALQQARIRIQKLTAEDKAKAKAEAAEAAKADKEAKKRDAAKAKAGQDGAGSIPTAAVSESTIDFRKAIRSTVHGAHV